MAQLNRDLLQKKKQEYKHVILEKYDMEFYVRKLSVKQLKIFSASKNAKNDEMDQMVDSILYCCIDKDGNQIFNGPNDRDLLFDQGIDLINALFAEIMDYCTIGDKEIDNKAKN